MIPYERTNQNSAVFLSTVVTSWLVKKVPRESKYRCLKLLNGTEEIPSIKTKIAPMETTGTTAIRGIV